MSETLLDSAEAAQYLGVCKQTLEKWRRLGRGPAYVRYGRKVRYRLKDLNVYVFTRIVRTKESPGKAGATKL